MSDLDDSSPPPRPPGRSRRSTPQRRPGTAAGDVVDPGPGDRVGGDAERQRLGRGQQALPLARFGVLRLHLLPLRARRCGCQWGTWPTPSAMSTPRCPGTACRWSRTSCGSPTPTAARTASGGSSTAMPTPPRSIRLPQLTHRRSKRQGGPKMLPQFPVPVMLGSVGATSLPPEMNPRRTTPDPAIAALQSPSMSGTGPSAARASELALVAWKAAARS